MDKVYKHQEIEKKWYDFWEKNGYFTPKIEKDKKPFTIILPPPNANDPMHMGHALFTIQDIMIRYRRMLGDPTLWLPGADHAGIETQFVFEKYLAKEGKSRFDFDRNTFYRMIADYVETNKNINRNQLKRMGFSLDWSRFHYSLESEIIAKVFDTFRKLHNDGLIYRGERIVNFCTRCGTSYSDLEIKYIERRDPLYYIKYGPFILATTRPETKFGDTAVAFHPGDKRYEKYLGQEIEIRGVNGPFKVKVIEDEAIDPDFGTGIEKVTPGHDALDFEIANRHNLLVKKIIDPDGRLNHYAGRFAGMYVKKARTAVYEAMKEMGLIDHVDENYVHNIAVCYKCGTTIEPLVIPQWFIKMQTLAKPAISAVKKGLTKIVPKKRFEKLYFDWLRNIHDWNISRQIIWGPRIPIWYCLDCNAGIIINFLDSQNRKISGKYNDLKKIYNFDEIRNGLQSLIAPQNATYSLEDKPCGKCYGKNVLQETDTFDTWFLSGQWPMNTLGVNIKKPDESSQDFKYFYPTSVLDTLWDILFFWVARMMMLGLYVTGKVPFETIHIHARVVDKSGQKMSKSHGNVTDPLVISEKYGADALRMALVIGVAPASDICFTEDKIIGMRNFTNKLWNIGRFMQMNTDYFKQNNIPIPSVNIHPSCEKLKQKDERILTGLKKLERLVTKMIENYRFGRAAELLYEFIWHQFADKYIEEVKERLKKNDVAALHTLLYVYTTLLTLLHPFMPFITEEINKQINPETKPLIISSYPTE